MTLPPCSANFDLHPMRFSKKDPLGPEALRLVEKEINAFGHELTRTLITKDPNASIAFSGISLLRSLGYPRSGRTEEFHQILEAYSQKLDGDTFFGKDEVDFNGKWENGFLRSLTAIAPFRKMDGWLIDVDMMSTRERVRYLEGAKFHLVEKAFKTELKESLSLVVVMPRHGCLFSGLEWTVDPSWLKQSRRAAVWQEAYLYLPRIHVDLSYENVVKNVDHRCRVRIGEEGDEGHQVSSGEGSLFPPSIFVDRPFYFFVMHGDIALVQGLVKDGVPLGCSG